MRINVDCIKSAMNCVVRVCKREFNNVHTAVGTYVGVRVSHNDVHCTCNTYTNV